VVCYVVEMDEVADNLEELAHHSIMSRPNCSGPSDLWVILSRVFGDDRYYSDLRVNVDHPEEMVLLLPCWNTRRTMQKR
jgi:hypothetical protein